MHMKAIAKMQVIPVDCDVQVSFTLNVELDGFVFRVLYDIKEAFPSLTVSFRSESHSVILSGTCNDEFVEIVMRFIKQIEESYAAMDRLLAIQKDINGGK